MSPEVSRKPRLVYLNSDVLRSDVDAVVAVSEIERARHVDRLPSPSLVVVVAVSAAAVKPGGLTACELTGTDLQQFDPVARRVH